MYQKLGIFSPDGCHQVFGQDGVHFKPETLDRDVAADKLKQTGKRVIARAHVIR